LTLFLTNLAHLRFEQVKPNGVLSTEVPTNGHKMMSVLHLAEANLATSNNESSIRIAFG